MSLEPFFTSLVSLWNFLLTAQDNKMISGEAFCVWTIFCLHIPNIFQHCSKKGKPYFFYDFRYFFVIWKHDTIHSVFFLNTTNIFHHSSKKGKTHFPNDSRLYVWCISGTVEKGLIRFILKSFKYYKYFSSFLYERQKSLLLWFSLLSCYLFSVSPVVLCDLQKALFLSKNLTSQISSKQLKRNKSHLRQILYLEIESH